MKRKGFTLVELLIVITIIAVMAVMLIGIFNSIGITNKARDAQRKKDLNRIKIAFEDYFNDKGYYPGNDLVQKLTDKNNCGKNIDDFPNLHPWPCDPNDNAYFIKVSPDTNKFVVLTSLENKKDKDIPNVISLNNNSNYAKSVMNNANYGVSSSNILWYDIDLFDYDKNCNMNVCLKSIGPGSCESEACDSSTGVDCYYGSNNGNNCKESVCKVICCGGGC